MKSKKVLTKCEEVAGWNDHFGTRLDLEFARFFQSDQSGFD